MLLRGGRAFRQGVAGAKAWRRNEPSASAEAGGGQAVVGLGDKTRRWGRLGG